MKNFLVARQANILSAAVIIMLSVAASRVLGLVRNRTYLQFFEPETLDTLLAAFQLPDLIFEVLVLGAMSSAFIPVFSSYLERGKDEEAWRIAAISLNLLLLFFVVLASFIFIFARPIYSVVAPGFSPDQVLQIASFTRILLAAQLFFVVSYVLTGVLESNQRFLGPAVAPLFYNLSIIAGTWLLAPKIGLYAPVLGAVAGAGLHLLVQLPLAASLGFRPAFLFDIRSKGIKSMTKLALPRVLELSFFQFKRLSDLFLASLIAGGLTYFKFAEQIALLPVSLFGLSIAKASLPVFSRQIVNKKLADFKATFSSSFKEIVFLVVPASTFLAVLRIPTVRLILGAQKLDWEGTVQTGYVLSAFVLGAFAYALALLVSRAFYALHDTSTPLKISIGTIFLNVGLAFALILGFNLPIWGLALAYALSGIVQVIFLLAFLTKRVGGFAGYGLGRAFTKIFIASGLSGTTMFVLLKILDRSAWDKKLSFLGKLGLGLPTTFDRFVLDTRYTVNLVILTAFVASVGVIVYLLVAYLLKVEELRVLQKAMGRVSTRLRPSTQEGETITPPPTNGA